MRSSTSPLRRLPRLSRELRAEDDLEIADCADRINLEFDLDSEPARANSLHKLDTLLAALRVFRAGLEAEFEHYDRRERELKELKGE
jgi:hypothetical protein